MTEKYPRKQFWSIERRRPSDYKHYTTQYRCTVEGLPTGTYLYDPYGVRYTCKETTTFTKDTTQGEIGPDVAKVLDEEKEVNPLDVLFAPDTDIRELGLHGHDEKGRFVAGGYKL